MSTHSALTTRFPRTTQEYFQTMQLLLHQNHYETEYDHLSDGNRGGKKRTSTLGRTPSTSSNSSSSSIWAWIRVIRHATLEDATGHKHVPHSVSLLLACANTPALPNGYSAATYFRKIWFFSPVHAFTKYNVRLFICIGVLHNPDGYRYKT